MAETTTPAEDVHRFWDAEALDASEALAVTQAAPTSVVVVAGPAESGKTTLVASLYEMFHYGPFGEFLFAGSRTLVGFEKRCHLSRCASGLEVPDTERTARTATQTMLHLRLGRTGDSRLFDVLITDIFGEAFRHAADSTEECQRLGVLRRADHVAILVDGAKLSAPKTRQQPFSDADALLRSCIDAGMLDAQSQVQLLITKRDLLVGGSNEARTLRFVDEKTKWIIDRYESRLGKISTHQVAVRPTTESALEVGHGLLSVFEDWVLRPRQPKRSPETPRISPQAFHSEFDRFARAHPAGSTSGGR